MVSGVAVATLVPAALVDLHVRRLPNRLSALAAVLLLVVGAVNGDLRPAGLAAGAALFAGPILVVHLWSPDAMGFGDVKAAVVLGAALGLVHWQLPVVALALATGATAAVGLTARARELPFGPGLVAGSALALAACTAFIPPSVDTAIAADRAPGQPDAATLPGGDRST